MIKPPTSDDRNEVYVALGAAVAAFSEIEQVVWELLALALEREPVRAHDVINGSIIPFRKRTEILERYSQVYFQEHFECIRPLLNSARTLAKKRNKYAHNPIVFSLEAGEEEPLLKARFTDRHRRHVEIAGHPLDVEKLHLLAGECHECAGGLLAIRDKITEASLEPKMMAWVEAMKARQEEI